jgi:lysozyme
MTMIDDALSVVVEELKGSEGFRSFVYDDATMPSRQVGPNDCDRVGGQYKVRRTGGTATIGYGETNSEVIDRHWDVDMSEEEATGLLKQSVWDRYFSPIRSLVSVDLNPNQWGALISLTYNIGVGGFSGSTVRRVVNSGRWGTFEGGPLRDAFLMWTTGNRPGELTGRRLKELALFFTPWEGGGADLWEDLFVPVLYG